VCGATKSDCLYCAFTFNVFIWPAMADQFVRGEKGLSELVSTPDSKQGEKVSPPPAGVIWVMYQCL
jgi:hypothetical protein